MKSFRIKLKPINPAFLNIKKIVRATTLLSVFLVSPVIIADTTKTVTPKTATGIITKIKGNVHLQHSGNQVFTGIKVFNKDELLRKKYPPLTPEMIQRRDLVHQKLPRAPAVMKMILPDSKLECASIGFNHDLDGDDATESYRMVSLLNCNEKNYVTPIREQQGGTCAAYSTAALIESHLGILLDRYRPNAPTDFLSINLSEGYVDNITQVGETFYLNSPDNGIDKGYGLTLDAYYPNSEYFAYWDTAVNANKPWAPRQDKLDALSTRYSVLPECRNLQFTNQQQFNNQLKNCLLAAARHGNMLFVNVDGKGSLQLPSVASNDYKNVDDDIKSHIQQGYVVQVSLNWVAHKINPNDSNPNTPRYGGVVADVPFPFQQTNYSLRLNRVNTTNAIPSRIAGHEHSVAIIGYLEDQGNTKTDYWIIKNSWGEQCRDNGRDVFDLIQIPSTAGPVTNINSTKRILGTSGYGIIEGLRFHKFRSDLTDPANINYTDAVRLNDKDGDKIIDFFDNCPLDDNPDQKDSDGDYVGDKCDNCKDRFDLFQPLDANPSLAGNDIDSDGIPNSCDNCVATANPKQIDTDIDGGGDVCDNDDDNDTFDDHIDNCPLENNPDQKDSDGDSIGDVCDRCPTTPATDDKDNDCALDSVDNCPDSYNRDQQDTDNDGIGDTCDNCPGVANPNGQDHYKIIRSRCGGDPVSVPVDCQTAIERVYNSLCDLMRGVELSELRLLELDAQRIKEIDLVGPPTGPKPWDMNSGGNTIKNKINIMKNNQVFFPEINEAEINKGMKELGIQPILLEQLKVKASGVIRK